MQSLCHQLLGALLNGGYQGLLLTATVWAGLRLLPRTNAATRHAVWFVTLLAVAALPVAHLLMKKSNRDRIFGAVRSEAPTIPPQPPDGDKYGTQFLTDQGMPPIPMDTQSPGVENFPAREGMVTVLTELSPRQAWPSTDQTAFPNVEANTRARGFPEQLEQSPAESNPVLAPSTPDPMETRSLNVILPGWLSVFLVSLWIGIGLTRLGHLSRQCLQLRTLKRRATTAPDCFHALFSALSAEMGLARRARLVMGPELTAPMALGYRHPAVMIPEPMFQGAGEDQVKQLLRHELAHLVRRDDWANLIQQTIHALLFIHPAVWWLSRRLTLEREIACDDHVLSATRDPRSYALFLTEFAGRMLSRDMVAAPAAWNKKKQLKERITMILDSKRNSSPRLATASLGVVTTLTVLVAVFALQAGPRLALAAESKTSGQVSDRSENSEVGESIEISNVAESQSDLVIQTDVNLATSTVEPASDPRPEPSPRTAIAVTGIVRPVAVTAPVAAKVSVWPVIRVQSPSPKIASISTSSGLTIASVAQEERSSTSAAATTPRRSNKGQSNENLDQRIERLERLVEELMAREKGPRDGKSLATKENDFGAEKIAKMTAEISKMAEKAAKAGLDEADVNRIRDQAKRDTERAARDIERAAREVQRAGALAEGKGGRADNPPTSERNQLEIQRKALESQRKSLEKEIQTIEKRLDQLHNAQDRLKERVERDDREKRSDQDSNNRNPNNFDDQNGPKKKAVQ